uniref:Uncharacterized protein n=1 Tax=Arundo donax TaxID=35708 RepID=A0A0A9F4B8_ARUDO
MLNNGMLKIFDKMLKIDTPIPADANSRAPNRPIYAVSISCANGSIAWPKTAGRARRISSLLTPTECISMTASFTAPTEMLPGLRPSSGPSGVALYPGSD